MENLTHVLCDCFSFLMCMYVVRPLCLLHSEVKIVKQMPTVTEGRKPTVAIITSKYYEKLAVDSMMEDKTTFVRYKTEGKPKIWLRNIRIQFYLIFESSTWHWLKIL